MHRNVLLLICSRLNRDQRAVSTREEPVRMPREASRKLNSLFVNDERSRTTVFICR